MEKKLETEFLRRYNNLNTAQKNAVDAVEGAVLVVAGPGSGKTELLAIRIANIVKIGLAKPEYILALTFTDSASNNMQDRLLKIMGRDAYRVPIFTFHSFCTHIISKYPEHFFDAHRFEPISELKQNEILDNIFSKIKYGDLLYGHHDILGYSYLGDVKECIKSFKEAGLTSQEVKNILIKNEKEIDIIDPIIQKYLPSRVTRDSIEVLVSKLANSKTELGSLYAKDISSFLENDNIGEIKKSLFKKNDIGEHTSKEKKYGAKLLAVVDVYEEYQNALAKSGYFDFNDMILYVKNRLLNNAELRAEIEETYQYILVDEFQDTNNAQLELIKSITSNPVLEGKANVFVVGDDDQSIYKFQGAELSNIFNFKKMYKDVKVIVLTENYRSTQKILDFAQKIISQGEERLVKKDKSLVKELIAKNTDLDKGDIYLNSFETKEEELVFVADKISNLLSSGKSAEEIAVISRKHSELQDFLPYLDTAKVAYNYERKESVFDQKHIQEIIIICAFLETIADSKQVENDELLSKIVSFEFLGLDRIDIWNISKEAYNQKKSWLDIMIASQSKDLKDLGLFLIELGVLAKTTPLEIIIDLIIGSKAITLESESGQDEYYHNSIPNLKSKYVSKYKEKYFGANVLQGDIASYIHFLSSLKVFLHALREHKKGENILVSDLSSFVALHKEYRVALLNKTAFAGNANAVNLLTAHKAKGLEFEYVFIIGAENTKWIGAKKGSKTPLPKNMPYSRKIDTNDDFLRLFFVALTRAKHTIYMTYSDRVLSFIAEEGDTMVTAEAKTHNDRLINGLSVYSVPPFAYDEKALLQKSLENYKLSPTHLSNFLNVSKGGPKLFLEQNLFRFPQSKSSSSVYGSAIHKAIEIMYIVTKKDGKVPAVEEVLAVFEKEISKSRLLKSDEENLIIKGKEKLHNFYNKQQQIIKSESKDCYTEVDFKSQGVVLEGAHITGKIDRIKIEDQCIEVVDIKSGKSFKTFDYKKTKEEDYENIKKHSYKQQLFMYKILLENSRDYSNKKVKKGVIAFVDSDQVDSLGFDFDEISLEELNNFKKLIVIVYKKITSLDFPDISKYSKDHEGILAFEKDLIEGNV